MIKEDALNVNRMITPYIFTLIKDGSAKHKNHPAYCDGIKTIPEKHDFHYI
jgi:hypothetical protein